MPGARPTDVPERSLTVPLLSRGPLDDKLFVALCVASFTFASGALSVLIHVASTAVVVAGFALAVASVGLTVAYGAALVRRRDQVEMTATGFVLSRGGRRRVFTDDQV